MNKTATILFAALPSAGVAHYGRKIERHVVVGRTHRSVVFEWPAQRA